MCIRDRRYAEDINYWLKVSLNNKMFILDEELLLAGEGKRTVSYTHLDVYKRQVPWKILGFGRQNFTNGRNRSQSIKYFIHRKKIAGRIHQRTDFRFKRNDGCLLYTSRCV